ncbi:MAG: sulfatase [Myxococcota bacterium]|nr:sulfatase [Myxococcota bacterium]
MIKTFSREEKKRGSGLVLPVLFFLLVLLGWGCQSEVSPPRSVILISLDTLRADHLGAYGYARPTSPNLDALADTGVVFEMALAQASSTLPSHRSLFRSRVPSRTEGPEPTLAEVVSEAGLTTAAFTGGGNVSAAFGFDRGFETYVDDPRGFAESFDEIEIWIRTHAQDRFMLFLHTYDIHLPYDPPAPYRDQFGAEYRGQINGRMTLDALRRERGFKGYRDQRSEANLSDADRAKVVDLYDGGILYTDTFIERLLLLLRELSLSDETAIVVFSDHGEEFWEHGSVLHSHTLYQELIHVPLIFSFPGHWGAGERIATPVQLLDIAPTVLDLLRIPIPKTFEGRSLLGLIRGDQAEPRGIASEIRNLSSRVEYPWKLIEEQQGKTTTRELFNLETDPLEKRDVLKERRDVGERMSAGLGGKNQSGDPAFVPSVDFEGVEPSLRQQLEALGYVEEERPTSSAAGSR